MAAVGKARIAHGGLGRSERAGNLNPRPNSGRPGLPCMAREPLVLAGVVVFAQFPFPGVLGDVLAEVPAAVYAVPPSWASTGVETTNTASAPPTTTAINFIMDSPPRVSYCTSRPSPYLDKVPDRSRGHPARPAPDSC